ncbi:Mitochondrial editing factor 9 [Heracleum sosnowskyi]|uniref:Mitochondrial editing factor 9 n=1 Tax=Heracleum sosnowskyi TaxID=360622 RepID=A0AAD8I9P5_9APIA|nr:Mitochondrial editing factor 9 [Heracleum sosnowskyi]
MGHCRLFSGVGKVRYCLCTLRPSSQMLVGTFVKQALVIGNGGRLVHTSRLNDVNKKILLLIRSSRLEDARALFDRTSNRNNVTWNSMLSGYVKGREIVQARKLFDRMPQRDVVSWNTMISGYLACGRRYLEESRLLFDVMPERDFVTWNTMINGYAKNGKLDEAFGMFNKMPERNVVSWNVMITAFLQNGDVGRAVDLFEKMPKKDGVSVSALISGLIKNGELDEAFRILQKMQLEGDNDIDLVHAYNTMIAGYGLKGRVDDARALFDKMLLGDGKRLKTNLVSWNTMIMCYVKSGLIVPARDLFDQMMERDDFSWNTMISGYTSKADMQGASYLFRNMPNPDMLSWNLMISGFAQMGNLELAHDFFRRMPQKNLVSWNSIIAGCERNRDYEGAIKLFSQMQLTGMKPDRHTMSSLLSVCAELVAPHLGMQIHQLVIKIFIPDVPLNNSIITMYARCGAIIEARDIFDEMKVKEVISWNAMIGGYASHGFAEEALELFGAMRKLRVQPTYITFISVLNACAHVGLVDQAKKHFQVMVDEFNIQPRVEHFASLVDVVGRHGQVEEAMDIISRMSVEPDKAVWGALLGACRVHNCVKLARVAAEALMRLEPESSAPYVMLYNMYAERDQWDDANEVRMLMERNSIWKEPAYSMVKSNH